VKAVRAPRRYETLFKVEKLQVMVAGGQKVEDVIGELVRNYLSVIKKGGAMKVVGLAPKVEEILKVTQLYQVFPEFPDEASALESFPGETKKRAEK